MMIIIFLQSGAYGLISNYLGSDCISSKKINALIGNLKPHEKIEYLKKHRICSLSFITRISLANKRHSYLLSEPQAFMNILTILVIMTVLQSMRYAQRRVILECDAAETTSSDFTVVVKKIPYGRSGL